MAFGYMQLMLSFHNKEAHHLSLEQNIIKPYDSTCGHLLDHLFL